MAENKEQTINPDQALVNVDNAVAQFHGNRADHRLLDVSMRCLQQVVMEWKSFKQVAALNAKAQAEKESEEDEIQLPLQADETAKEIAAVVENHPTTKKKKRATKKANGNP